MGKKPKIAVTCSFEEKSGYHKIRRSYVEALANSGGVPYVLPHFSDSNLQAEEILRDIDGLVLSGGTDVDPKWFDQEPRYNLLEIVPYRDSLEIELAREARKTDIPILGICRGLQVINIAAGGEIYQD
ncbi:gamma-glutamyl-gamma-aminobutyrate hydrolase family protein, partial [Candidatus Bipolaricaulota bacterium]|nr:gamma-glutamyl-gamma-aminobutyrate hydrolase family protein [Candidatus Bipolaricaulota bacterium]